MPASLLQVASKTQAQAKCALARAKLHRRLSAHAATRPEALALLEMARDDPAGTTDGVPHSRYPRCQLCWG